MKSLLGFAILFHTTVLSAQTQTASVQYLCEHKLFSPAHAPPVFEKWLQFIHQTALPHDAELGPSVTHAATQLQLENARWWILLRAHERQWGLYRLVLFRDGRPIFERSLRLPPLLEWNPVRGPSRYDPRREGLTRVVPEDAQIGMVFDEAKDERKYISLRSLPESGELELAFGVDFNCERGPDLESGTYVIDEASRLKCRTTFFVARIPLTEWGPPF